MRRLLTLMCVLSTALLTQCTTTKKTEPEPPPPVPTGPKHVEINLATQHGELIQGECVLFSFPVCTGKRSKPTPTGNFRIIGKERYHESNLYPDSPMPFFMRLTNDGIGMHQGPMRSKPSSHGCIRLHRATAKRLFKECPMGTRVNIVRREPTPPPAPEEKDKKKP